MMSFVGVVRHCRESSPAGYSVRNGSKADISIGPLAAVFTVQLLAMWRSSGEQISKVAQVDAVTLLERGFTESVLLEMVITTQADRPAIGRLQGDASIGIAADMGTLDGTPKASGNTAVMAAHPGTMSRTVAATRLASALTLKPVRKL